MKNDMRLGTRLLWVGVAVTILALSSLRHSAAVQARTEDNGRNVIWLMDASAAFRSAHDGHVIKEACDTTPYDVPGWRIVNTGPVDFDGDGKGDILWWQGDPAETGYGATVVWLMDGCTLTLAVYGATVGDADWKLATFSDVDGDGKTDIVWHYQEE